MSKYFLAVQRRRGMWGANLALALGMLVARPGPTDDREPSLAQYATPRRIADLEHPDLDESSGLAPSRLRPGVFWTHNDSGDSPRIFAFDSAGKDMGVCRLVGAAAIDWEDMASFERDGASWLLVADVGNNGRRRETCQLYLCREPALGVAEAAATKLEFRYADTGHDCESVAVDARSGTILLCTKRLGLSSEVFELPLPAQPVGEILVAQRIGTISVGLSVAMDVTPDGSRAVVLTYGDAFEFTRGPEETWREAFSRSPRRISMPLRRQGEAICYGHDGRSLFLTSERQPAPLWHVPWSPGSASAVNRPRTTRAAR